jgi:hypothetical protein
VIVDKIKVKSIAALKAKDDAPISADGKTPVAGEITLQAV